MIFIVVHTWPDRETGTETGRIISARKATPSERRNYEEYSISKLTDEQREEIAALKESPDDSIDTTDPSETIEWSMASRGVFYRPVKQQITLQLDADIVAWFKKHASEGRGYQSEINRVLRRHVQHSENTAP